jgi:hypothetical protein
MKSFVWQFLATILTGLSIGGAVAFVIYSKPSTQPQAVEQNATASKLGEAPNIVSKESELPQISRSLSDAKSQLDLNEVCLSSCGLEYLNLEANAASQLLDSQEFSNGALKDWLRHLHQQTRGNWLPSNLSSFKDFHDKLKTLCEENPVLALETLRQALDGSVQEEDWAQRFIYYHVKIPGLSTLLERNPDLLARCADPYMQIQGICGRLAMSTDADALKVFSETMKGKSYFSDHISDRVIRGQMTQGKITDPAPLLEHYAHLGTRLWILETWLKQHPDTPPSDINDYLSKFDQGNEREKAAAIVNKMARAVKPMP